MIYFEERILAIDWLQVLLWATWGARSLSNMHEGVNVWLLLCLRRWTKRHPLSIITVCEVASAVVQIG